MLTFIHKLPAGVLFALAAWMPALAAGPYPNTGNFGVPFSKNEAWYKQCMRVEQLQPAPATAPAPAGCRAIDLYYRKRSQAQTSPAEWEQVRACAIASKDNAVLMMMYANGYGVVLDTDRAIHHACILDFIAKREMEVRIAHLAQGPQAGKPFDLCDDITSGYMGGICSALRETRDSHTREGRLERAVRSLPANSRRAFTTLRQAAERYADAGAAETDMQGSAAADFAIRHEARLREEFMQAVLDAIGGRLPPASAEDYAARDRELNLAYQDVMNIPSTQADWPDRIADSTIAHADVRKAERLWLAYRDAFIAFAASLPSGGQASALGTLLTTQRSAELRKLARYR